MRRITSIFAAGLLSAVVAFQACTSQEVVGVVVVDVAVQPTAATVTIGDSVKLTAVIQDDRGEVIGQAVPDWESSADEVAAVDSSGMVWGLRAGTVDISASFGEVSGSAQITVTPPPVYGFLVLETSGSTVVSEAGDTDELTLVLLTQPFDDVRFDLVSADTGEVVVDSISLTFTPEDWSTPRTITASGVADGVVDGEQATALTVSVDPASDGSYSGLPPQVVAVASIDAEIAGFSVTQTGGTTRVDEGESTDTLLVRLDARPETDVVLGISSADPGEVVLDSATVTFTPDAWDLPVPVVVSGVDDDIDDGNQRTLVTIAVVDESSDTLWSDVPDQAVEVETLEGQLGLAITESGDGTTVDESGSEDTFDVVLTRAPAGEVRVSITVPDETEVTADKTTLTFKPDDWDEPQTVKAKGVDDPAVDGDQVTAVAIEVLPGSDPDFLGEEAQEVRVTTTDDDEAGFEVEEHGGETIVDEGGGQDHLHIALTAQPLTDVTLTISSADSGEVVPETESLVFTPDNWEDIQRPQLVGVDDDLVDGSTFTAVTVAVDPSSDPAFVGLRDTTIVVENEDDERAHFEIVQTGGTTLVTEGGSSDAFDVILLVRPARGSEVTITAVSTDESEVTVSPPSVTIERRGWDEPRTFTVTGVDDEELDGDQVTTILLQVEATSWDYGYWDARDRALEVTTIDDEGASNVGGDDD